MRAVKVSQAFARIKKGEKVANAAFESGYNSLSGFASSFKKTAAFSPRNSDENQLIQTTRLFTPLGLMLAGSTEDGICVLQFSDSGILETEIKRLSKLLNAICIPGLSTHLEHLNNQLQEYFSGERKEFDVPLVLAGTPFQEKVWAQLQGIPYGSTRSYQEQAETIGLPKAIRAVAKASGDNHIAILVPCHRVLGINGELTGYGGGLWRKQYLLKHETSIVS